MLGEAKEEIKKSDEIWDSTGLRSIENFSLFLSLPSTETFTKSPFLNCLTTSSAIQVKSSSTHSLKGLMNSKAAPLNSAANAPLPV